MDDFKELVIEEIKKIWKTIGEIILKMEEDEKNEKEK